MIYAKITLILLAVLLVSNLLMPIWDAYATTTFVQSFSVSGQDTVPQDLAFSSNGMKLFMIGDDGNDVNEYACTTAFEAQK